MNKVSTYSGLGNLEEISEVQLRLMRMKKKNVAVHGLQERRATSSNDHYSRRESRESKDEESMRGKAV